MSLFPHWPLSACPIPCSLGLHPAIASSGHPQATQHHNLQAHRADLWEVNSWSLWDWSLLCYLSVLLSKGPVPTGSPGEASGLDPWKMPEQGAATQKAGPQSLSSGAPTEGWCPQVASPPVYESHAPGLWYLYRVRNPIIIFICEDWTQWATVESLPHSWCCSLYSSIQMDTANLRSGCQHDWFLGKTLF